MNFGITILVIFLLILILLGFPTRRRMERAFIPRQGPGPWVRLKEALHARRRRRLRRRRGLKGL